MELNFTNNWRNFSTLSVWLCVVFWPSEEEGKGSYTKLKVKLKRLVRDER